MKTKTIFILGLILTTLIAGVIYKKFQQPAELTTEEFDALDLSFDKEKVEKIALMKGKDQMLFDLVKTDGRWSVVNFFKARGDLNKINNLMQKIQTAKGELRGHDKELFKDFGMGEDEGYRLTLSDAHGEVILGLNLGTKRTNYDRAFIRKSDSDDVYLSNAGLFEAMGLYADPSKETPKAEFLVQGTLFDVNPEDINRLEIKRFKDGKELIAAQVFREVDAGDSSKKRWKYGRSERLTTLDAEKLKSFLKSFGNYQTSKVYDLKAKDYGFEKPSWRMSLGLDGGKEIVVLAGGENPETKGRYMQVSGEPVVFEYSTYALQAVDVDDSKFFIDNPFGIDPTKITKLVIHSQSEELSFQPVEKKWDTLITYMNDIKGITVSQLLLEAEEQQKAQNPKQWIEITQDGGAAPIKIEVGETVIVGNNIKVYAARLAGNPSVFAIAEGYYKTLFENLSRLADPSTA